jgi:hypothetical protein
VPLRVFSVELRVRKSCTCSQIMTWLLAGKEGYLPGYEIYEGNTCEGDTLLPLPESLFSQYPRFRRQ